MLPGNDLILICPYCEGLKSVMSLLSGSTFGAVYWSDGYGYSPLLLRNAPVQQCDACKRYYWIEAEKRPVYADTSACEPSLLSSGQWMEALRQFEREGTRTAEGTRTIRLHILWTLNHVETSYKDEALFLENNKELLRLMYPLKEEDFLLCAELYRENGNFHACVRLLRGHDFAHERQRQIASQILEAAGRRETNVFKI